MSEKKWKGSKVMKVEDIKKLEDIKKMVTGDVNLKIAEICGWKKGPCGCGNVNCPKEVRFQNPRGEWVDECPDFSIDLNALAEVEQKILFSDNTWENNTYKRYVEVLSQVFSGNPIFAGAYHRAVAFLVVMLK